MKSTLKNEELASIRFSEQKPKITNPSQNSESLSSKDSSENEPIDGAATPS